jgi:siroheme synthase
MGYENLRPIADGLIRYGKHKDTPAAVIHGNTDNTQEIVRGTLADIADKVEKSKIPTPAVIVVGEVVGVI